MQAKEIPVLLKPAYFTHIWGGELLKKHMNKNYTHDNVGESWEISAHPKGNSIIASGEFKGTEFGEYYTKILGNKQEYPLLIKLIGPKSDLSVQVHPNDSYAKKHENAFGKKEAWYILSTPPTGRIVAGINCTKEEFSDSIKRNTIRNTLEYIECQKGDVFAIDPGMVHALLKDVIVYEVQQNSDITYRIYDWNRIDKETHKPRQLHVDKALDVILFDKKCKAVKSDDSDYQVLINNELFSLIKIVFDGSYNNADNQGGAYTLIEGNAQVESNGNLLFKLTKGDSFYAPIGNNFKISGKGELLKSIEK